VCLPAYVEGLAAEGLVLDAAVVARAHALQLLFYAGISAVPVDDLGLPVTPALVESAAQAAAVARFSLDLLEATGG
jgi:hypothetical protein